jgi:hypothetical protein
MRTGRKGRGVLIGLIRLIGLGGAKRHFSLPFILIILILSKILPLRPSAVLHAKSVPCLFRVAVVVPWREINHRFDATFATSRQLSCADNCVPKWSLGTRGAALGGPGYLLPGSRRLSGATGSCELAEFFLTFRKFELLKCIAETVACNPDFLLFSRGEILDLHDSFRDFRID